MIDRLRWEGVTHEGRGGGEGGEGGREEALCQTRARGLMCVCVCVCVCSGLMHKADA
jgi:hypothetical protein